MEIVFASGIRIAISGIASERSTSERPPASSGIAPPGRSPPARRARAASGPSRRSRSTSEPPETNAAAVSRSTPASVMPAHGGEERVIQDDREQERHDEPERLAQCERAAAVVTHHRRDPHQRPRRQGTPSRWAAHPARSLHRVRRSAAADRSRNCRPSWRASWEQGSSRRSPTCVTRRLSRSPRDSEASTQSSSARACSRPRRILEQRELAERDAGVDLGDATAHRVALLADQHAARDDDVQPAWPSSPSSKMISPFEEPALVQAGRRRPEARGATASRTARGCRSVPSRGASLRPWRKP